MGISLGIKGTGPMKKKQKKGRGTDGLPCDPAGPRPCALWEMEKDREPADSFNREKTQWQRSEEER